MVSYDNVSAIADFVNLLLFVAW